MSHRRAPFIGEPPAGEIVPQKTAKNILETLRRDGNTVAGSAAMATYDEFMDIVSYERLHRFEKEFGQP